MTAGEFAGLNFTVLASWPVVINLLTHSSLLLELLYPVLIWVKLLRPLMLAGAAALHLGIAITNPGLAEFALAMLAANLAFVPGNWLRGLVAGPVQPGLTVLYDGACPRCRASAALIVSADPDHVIHLVDLTAVDVRGIHPSLSRDACVRSMHSITGQGVVSAGFDSMLAIGRRLPLFWIPALIGSIPGLAWAGRFSYNAVAASRRAMFPAPMMRAGSPPGSRSAAPRDRGEFHIDHNVIAPESDTEEMARP